ncbi:hypothetical protein ACH5A3_21110 [Streptomyces echinatus]|uniref:hypothetical protein n=1 Tax=Streptomyces echinatus TaxID=67293 RepID=UPI0037AC6611
MRWPLVSRARYDALRARADQLCEERDEALADLGTTGRAFDCIAVELDQAKDVIAHHIVATGDTALRDQLAAAGVDMRLHLADAEKKGARP